MKRGNEGKRGDKEKMKGKGIGRRGRKGEG